MTFFSGCNLFYNTCCINLSVKRLYLLDCQLLFPKQFFISFLLLGIDRIGHRIRKCFIDMNCVEANQSQSSIAMNCNTIIIGIARSLRGPCSHSLWADWVGCVCECGVSVGQWGEVTLVLVSAGGA